MWPFQTLSRADSGADAVAACYQSVEYDLIRLWSPSTDAVEVSMNRTARLARSIQYARRDATLLWWV